MSYYIQLTDCQFTVDARYAKQIAAELADYWYEGIFDENGNIVEISFNGEKLRDEFEMFQRIAPMVDDGCFLQVSGEDGSLWRWVFKNGKCYGIDALITWPDIPAENDETGTA